MDDSHISTIVPSMLGRALLAKFDADTVHAITAAIAEEIREDVAAAIRAEERTRARAEFDAEHERLRDVVQVTMADGTVEPYATLFTRESIHAGDLAPDEEVFQDGPQAAG